MNKVLLVVALLAVSPFAHGQGASRRVDTLVELLTINPWPFVTAGSSVSYNVGGYTALGDWGGDRVADWVATSTATTNRAHVFATAGGGRWVFRDVAAPEQRATWFGATPESGDASVAIQAAADYASPRRMVVHIPAGLYYISNTVAIPPNITIRGDGPADGYYGPHVYQTNIANDLSYIRKEGRTVLMLANNANVPMFTNKLTGYALPSATSIYDGRGTVTPRYLNSSLIDIALDGNDGNQTRRDCDLVRLTDCWNFTIKNVYFFRPSGYWVRLWNCNVIKINDYVMNGGRASKGIMVWDTSDSMINDGMSGGNIGPSIWLASPTTWFNNISDLHIGDSVWHGTGGMLLSVAGNSMTLDNDPKLETGDPFVFWRGHGGTLPAGITNGQVYFAIKEATNRYGFSWSLPNALAGSKDAISDIGTNIAIKPGPSSAMAFNQATYNLVTDVRFDNSTDGNVIFEDADYNTVANALVMRAGGSAYATTNGIGIWLREGSGNNQLSRITSWFNNTGIRVDSPNNILDGATFGQTATNFNVQTSVAVGLTYNLQYGGVSGSITNYTAKQFLFEGDVLAIPVKIVGTNAPSILEISRVGTAAGATRLGQSVDSDARPAFTLTDSASASRMASFQASLTNATLAIGGDFDTRTGVVARIRPGDPSGTNRSGFNLELQGGSGTGMGAPGRLSLRAPIVGVITGVVVQATEEVANVTQTGLHVTTGKGITLGGVYNTNWPSGADPNAITNAVAGANVTITRTNQTITVSATSGGSSATNGTAVGVDGSGALTVVNFGDTADTEAGISGTNAGFLLTATGVVSGSYTNPAITVDSKGRLTFATNGTSGGGSGTNYTQFYYDLTNTLVAGANVTLTPGVGTLTIASTGGGGSTNGTAVAVDGTLQTAVNLADGSEIEGTLTGTNWVYSVVPNSLGTNKLTTAAWSAIVNRTNHYGTQNWTTIHTLPTAIARIADIGAGTSGDIIYRDATGWTNAQLTSLVPALTGPVVLYVNKGATTNLYTTTNETTIVSTIRPGGNKTNTLAEGDMLKLEFIGRMSNGAAGGWTDNRLRVKIGGYTVMFQTEEPDSFDAMNYSWKAVVYLNVVSAGASAVVSAEGWMEHQYGAHIVGSVTNTFPFMIPATFSGTLDTTSPVIIDATWESQGEPATLVTKAAIVTKY